MADIRELLFPCSEGELKGYLGMKVVSLYETVTGESVSKEMLVEAVATLYGHQILSSADRRRTLIERADKKRVEQLVEDFCSELKVGYEKKETVDPYEFLIRLAEIKPAEFTSFFHLSEGSEKATDGEKSVEGIKALEPAYPLYPYQNAIVRKVFSYLDGENNRCLIHLPTGAGKTRTAVNIAAEHLRAKKSGLVLWLADTSELCAQAAAEFSKAWKALGSHRLKLYSYYSDTEISLGGIDQGFLIASLQKLNSAYGSQAYRVLYEQLRQNVSLIIFDEAHKAIAPTYSRIVTDMMGLKNETLLIGLSATPGRSLDLSSEEDEKLACFFGEKKITMQIPGYSSPIKYLVEQNYLAESEFIPIHYEGASIKFANEFSSAKRSQEIREALSEESDRNLKLLQVISKEYEQGSSIIVFACSVEHSQNLASMLSFKGIRAFSLDSKDDNASARRFKVSKYLSGEVRVLVNFNILTAGFDAPRTNVCIIARPTDSLVMYSQMAGRAMRGLKSGGNRRCKIYTVRDDIPAFQNVTKAFMHWDEMWQEI